MATNHQPQMATNHFLTPFTFASDCPQENREIIYRIIINYNFRIIKFIENNNKKQNIYNKLTFIEII